MAACAFAVLATFAWASSVLVESSLGRSFPCRTFPWLLCAHCVLCGWSLAGGVSQTRQAAKRKGTAI